MAPSTRSKNKAGKDASPSKQATLDANANVKPDETVQEDPLSKKKTEKKRDADDLVNPQEQDKADQPSPKRQKQQAAKNQKFDDADALDEQSEKAKADGREIFEQGDTKKPGRGTLESGHVYFMYKPKVETEDPDSIDDIAKCHVLLLPNPSGSNTTKYRVLTFGRKHLPGSRDEQKHETEWGIISAVGDDLGALKDSFGASSYETKTRGTRHQPASRCAGYGHYILHSPTSGDGVKPEERASDRHPRDHPLYLAYSISVPLHDDFGDVQRELDIKPTGTFAIQVKNPDAPSANPRAGNVPSDRQQQLPPELRGLFTTRWIPANPIELLDYQGHELLFISGREHLPDGAEKEVEKPAEDDQKEVKEEEGKKDDNQEVLFKEVYEELHLYKDKKDAPGLRALEGEWA